jgi:16S rRNA (uracil1498-N3)-methyltransferase
LAQLQRLAIAPSQIQNQQIFLNAEQQHYLVRVLRLREGDRFIAIDGQGQWWLARLKAVGAIHESPLQGEIIEALSVQTELPASVTLMVALPKGNGFDEVVRCCTELGVAGIAPVISDRTLLHPSSQKLERWRRIAVEAAEQSERQIIPTILDPVPFAVGLSLVASQDSLVLSNGQMTHDKRYICVARGDSPHLLYCLHNSSLLALHSALTIATGPEGGWTPAEIQQASSAGFQPVSLGRRILKAVTAPIVAMSLVAATWESENSQGG